VTCSQCGTERAAANLTLVDGVPWCPLCLFKKAEYEYTHQKVTRRS
jgi:formylmethanofuran dehydrogenase subunit E